MAYKNNDEAGSSKSGNIAYDPDQDPEERRDLRKKYRDLRARIEGIFNIWRIDAVYGAH
jgi:non-structural maintenance of chromosomes element 4